MNTTQNTAAITEDGVGVAAPGTDDVETAYRHWALDQVLTGQLNPAEAIAEVPGAQQLISHALTRRHVEADVRQDTDEL